RRVAHAGADRTALRDLARARAADRVARTREAAPRSRVPRAGARDRRPAALTPPLDLRAYVRDVPDFPKQGIVFKDITPLLLDPAALSQAIRQMAERAERPQAVVAIESRGFIFGAGLALHWNVPFVPARKFGKLPGRTVRQVYSLEYGEDTLELHA